MKRVIQLAATLALCLAAATPALAGGSYTGVSVVDFDQTISMPGISDHGYSTGVMTTIGTNLNEILAIEVRVGGTNSANFSQLAVNQKSTLKSFLFRAKLPLAKGLRVYALFGTTNGDVMPTGSMTGNDNRTSLSYGGGLQVHGVHWSASIEWMRYWDKVNVGSNVDITIDGLAATMGYTF